MRNSKLLTSKQTQNNVYISDYKNSIFYKMVQQLGEAEAAALTERAKQVSLLQGVVVEVCL